MLRFVLAALAVTSVASAQAPNIRMTGRMHMQYRASGGDSTSRYDPAAVDQSFLVRRLRINAEVRFGDHILLMISPSFEMGALRMRDAYLRVGLTPRLGVSMGQEKTPFSRYELTSSNQLPSIERGVVISGLAAQQEAMNNLVVANGYASHDLGAFVDYAAPGNRFTIKAGVQGGSRESTRDVNNAKSYSARATATVLTNADDQPVLQLGAAFAARDRAVCRTFTGTGPFICTAFYADSSKMTTAFGFDLEWGGFRPGPHVIADFAVGDNVPLARRYNSTPFNLANVGNSADSNVVRFVSVHVVAAWRVMVGNETSVVRMLEPALRVDNTDANTDAPEDDAWLITPAVSVFFSNTVALRLGFDYYSYVAAGERFTAQQLIMQWQANF